VKSGSGHERACGALAHTAALRCVSIDRRGLSGWLEGQGCVWRAAVLHGSAIRGAPQTHKVDSRLPNPLTSNVAKLFASSRHPRPQEE